MSFENSDPGWAERRALLAGAMVFVPTSIGVYNHALKDALFFGGASAVRMRMLFPPPTYEMPNDWFFEVTGVLQVIPAVATAYYLDRLIRRRHARRTA